MTERERSDAGAIGARERSDAGAIGARERSDRVEPPGFTPGGDAHRSIGRAAAERTGAK